MAKRKKNPAPEGQTERRAVIVPVVLEKRDDEAESRHVSGYAAVFDQKTNIGGWYEEQIARGAFDECDFSHCVLNWNHDDSSLLGRVSSGTLKLEVDEKGLRFDCDLPDTTLGNDILTLIRRGDIEGCSFAFIVRENKWEWLSDEDPSLLDQRTITKISAVYDVSVVTHPAYEQTSVDARSAEAARDEHKEQRQKEEEEKQQAEAESQSRLRQMQTITLNIF